MLLALVNSCLRLPRDLADVGFQPSNSEAEVVGSIHSEFQSSKNALAARLTSPALVFVSDTGATSEESGSEGAALGLEACPHVCRFPTDLFVVMAEVNT